MGFISRWHATLHIPNVWTTFPSVQCYLYRIIMSNLSLKKPNQNKNPEVSLGTSALLKLHCERSAVYFSDITVF